MEESSLQLEPLQHRGENCISIRGRVNAHADKVIRAFPSRKFSKTHHCWYIPYTKELLTQLIQQLTPCQPLHVATFEVQERHEPLRGMPVLPAGYHECLVRVRYSEATVKTYESQMRKFLEWISPKGLDDLTDGLINEYQFYLAQTKRVSISTQNTAINAIKFYLEKVHHGERKVYYVERPLPEEKLPAVLTQEEMKALIEATVNVKHRCMMLIMYSSGVRISELLNLKWADFDEGRLELFVHGGKGRKDRITIISKAALDYTKFYLKQYKPKEYIFESPAGGKYSSRSVNQVIHRSQAIAGIRKEISAHTLRHSFATHILEQKTDIRYIQVLLGHESSKTTERYTHMTTKGFKGIKSPLDELNLDLGIPEDTTDTTDK